MRKAFPKGLLGLVVLGLLALGAVTATPLFAGDDRRERRGGFAVLRDADGDRVGAARLTQQRGVVLVVVGVRDLPPGFHGFHVHPTGACEPPFNSAGGHLDGGDHGAHAGDLPSLLVNENGRGFLAFTTDRFRLNGLLDDDGSALIIHAGRDNYANIPERYHSHETDTFGPDTATRATGDSGDRVACGVVRRKSR